MPLTDSDRPDGDGRPGTAEGRSTAPVGTVAEEAAKLVEMLAATGGPWAGTAGHGAAAGDAGPQSSSHTQTCTCGGSPPQACRLCPVCQVISFVSSISPETIDRAADLVGFAATALRDLATAQRERQQASQPGARTEEDPS